MLRYEKLLVMLRCASGFLFCLRTRRHGAIWPFGGPSRLMPLRWTFVALANEVLLALTECRQGVSLETQICLKLSLVLQGRDRWP